MEVEPFSWAPEGKEDKSIVSSTLTMASSSEPFSDPADPAAASPRRAAVSRRRRTRLASSDDGDTEAAGLEAPELGDTEGPEFYMDR